VDTLISNASTTFDSTIGFSWGSVLDYIGSLIKLVIGMGAGVFQSSFGWILVLAAIGLVYGLLCLGWSHFHPR